MVGAQHVLKTSRPELDGADASLDGGLIMLASRVCNPVRGRFRSPGTFSILQEGRFGRRTSRSVLSLRYQRPCLLRQS